MKINLFQDELYPIYQGYVTGYDDLDSTEIPDDLWKEYEAVLYLLHAYQYRIARYDNEK